jgi:hypothetical protein
MIDYGMRYASRQSIADFGATRTVEKSSRPMSAWKVCLCAIALAFSAAWAEARMIDSFSAGDQALFVDPYAATAFRQFGTAAAIGGHRDLTLQFVPGDLDLANVLASDSELS